MPARIDPATVQHIAQLSRLKLTGTEAARCGEQLSAILAAFDTLNQYDTTDIEPTAHPLALHNVLRDDTPAAPLGAELVLMNAPRVEAGCFALPKVLDQEGA